MSIEEKQVAKLSKKDVERVLEAVGNTSYLKHVTSENLGKFDATIAYIREEGTIVSFATYYTRGKKDLNIKFCRTAEGFTGKGYMSSVLESLIAKDFYHIHIEVRPENKEMQSLVLSLGFKKTGQAKKGRWHNILVDKFDIVREKPKAEPTEKSKDKKPAKPVKKAKKVKVKKSEPEEKPVEQPEPTEPVQQEEKPVE